MAATATFQYAVRDKAGQVVTGKIDAESPAQVASKLKSMGYAPLKISAVDNPWQPCDCVRDLPLDETSGPYPTVFFFHGRGLTRAEFPSLESGIAHFDNPGGTQTPRVVGEAIAGTLTGPLSQRQREYVEAARALGASTPRILFKHLLYNIVGGCVINGCC